MDEQATPPQRKVPGRVRAWLLPTPAGERLLEHPADWPWWSPVLAFISGTALGTLVGSAVAGLLGGRSGTAELAGNIALDICTLGVILVWLRYEHPGWLERVGVPEKPLDEIWPGFLGGLVIYLVAAAGIATLFNMLISLFTGAPAPAPDQLPPDLSGGEVALSVLFAVVLAPITEELFFRGLLFRAVRTRRAFWIAALASGVPFGSVHWIQSPGTPVSTRLLLVVTMTCVGMGFAYVYERRGNLLAPIAAHATFNIIGLVFILSGRT